LKAHPRIYILAAVGFAAYGIVKLAPSGPAATAGVTRRAAEIMAVAEGRIRECREARGIPPDISSDINRTGLIGVETSPVTTTLGDLEAKRTVTNPNLAGLVVRLFVEAGVKRGDVVAVGASSSFPGSILAVLSAAEAMGLDVLGICSLGASQWGANDPRFDWLDMYACASRGGGLPARWLALSIGGENDAGTDLGPGGRRLIEDRIRRTGIAFFEERDLARNVGRRMRLYEQAAAGRPIRVFVNIGGAWANIGTNSSVLGVEPGLARVRDIPPPSSRGVLQEMASRGIPVIHLLNVKGLASKYGLPLDPGPLPAPGEWPGAVWADSRNLVARIAGWAYLGLVVFVLAAGAVSTSRFSRPGPGCPSGQDSGAGTP
jgi:poly-gamma-glutamate system protein